MDRNVLKWSDLKFEKKLKKHKVLPLSLDSAISNTISTGHFIMAKTGLQEVTVFTGICEGSTRGDVRNNQTTVTREKTKVKPY